MAERREEEEEEEGARPWVPGSLYRPKSSWVSNVVTGGGRFGPGRLDGERAEEAAALRRPGCRGGSGAAWDACAREEMPRGGPGGFKRFPRVHLAVGARWTKSTGGVRRAARTEQAGKERDGDKGIFVISEIPGTSR
jgi:hypothetical protein